MKTPFSNPFPFKTPTGLIILNEQCQCGELRTRHGPGRAGGFGHGECPESGCKQFTWKAHVMGERKGTVAK